MIFFSVIITTYNRAALVTETIDSVLAQTYPHFELIIVDDGSTDATRQIIESRYGNDLRVRYFYKQNEERGAARNFGMKQAKGNYAVIFDSDDWMHDNHLSVLETNISSAEKREINFIATKYQLKEDSGKIINVAVGRLPGGWYGTEDILKGNYFGCLYAVRLGNPNLQYFHENRAFATLEDWMFLFANLVNDKICLVDEKTITVRHNENRSTADNQRVIRVRKLATKWIIDNIHLTKTQVKKLQSWSHYYCGVHQYLDYKRWAAVKEATLAIRKGGMNKKFFLLLSKSLLGRTLVARVK